MNIWDIICGHHYEISIWHANQNAGKHGVENKPNYTFLAPKMYIFFFFSMKPSNNCSDFKQYFHGTLPLTIHDIQ